MRLCNFTAKKIPQKGQSLTIAQFTLPGKFYLYTLFAFLEHYFMYNRSHIVILILCQSPTKLNILFPSS